MLMFLSLNTSPLIKSFVYFESSKKVTLNIKKKNTLNLAIPPCKALLSALIHEMFGFG